MKLSHILFVIYFTVISSSFFIFIFGEKGLLEYNKLLEHHNVLVGNIKDLQEKNFSLEERRNLLLSDAESIRLLARELGLYEKDESVIRISGYSKKSDYYDLGKIIKYLPAEGVNNDIYRIIGFVLSLVFILLFIVKKFAYAGKT